jgi:hypothetical protein
MQGFKLQSQLILNTHSWPFQTTQTISIRYVLSSEAVLAYYWGSGCRCGGFLLNCTGKLFPLILSDQALDAVYSCTDLGAVETEACDGQVLASAGVPCIRTHLVYHGHSLGLVTCGLFVVALAHFVLLKSSETSFPHHGEGGG